MVYLTPFSLLPAVLYFVFQKSELAQVFPIWLYNLKALVSNPKHNVLFCSYWIHVFLSKSFFSIYIKSVYKVCLPTVFPYNISQKFNWMLVCFIMSANLILCELQKARWSPLLVFFLFFVFFLAYHLFKYFWTK